LYKTSYNKGDTLTIKVRNLTPAKQSFTITANSETRDPFYYNQMYSSYLNGDTSYAKKLRKLKEAHAENSSEYKYLSPVSKLYQIEGKSDTTLRFILNGTILNDGVTLKLNIRPEKPIAKSTGAGVATVGISRDIDLVWSTPFKVYFLPE
jgi:hypothetical protein